MSKNVLILALLVIAIITSMSIGCSIGQVIEDITAQEGFALIQENEGNPDFIIVDVRTPEEFVNGHLEDAINLNINSEDFLDELQELDKDKTYLIYCRSGSRSAQAVAVMEELGYKEVYDMGGIMDWTAEGFHIVK